MAPDEERELRTYRAELSVQGWRLRWALFSVVWVPLVLLFSAWLWPGFVGHGRPAGEVLAGIALVAVGPPALDYVVSRTIARLLQRRLHQPH